LELTRQAVLGRDGSEGGAGRRGVGTGQVCAIQRVVDLEAQLKLRLLAS